MKNHSYLLNYFLNSDASIILSMNDYRYPETINVSRNECLKQEPIFQNAGKVHFKILFEVNNSFCERHFLALQVNELKSAIKSLSHLAFDQIFTFGENNFQHLNLDDKSLHVKNTFQYQPEDFLHHQKLKEIFETLIFATSHNLNSQIQNLMVFEEIPISFNERAYARSYEKRFLKIFE